MYIYLYNFIYIHIESVLIAVTVKKQILYILGGTLFWVFSFVHKIVLFGAFPRAKNRALDRAFWCSPLCTKSCFLGALPRAKNCAFCSPSCQKPCSRSCFLVLSFVPKIVLFGLMLSFVPTTVLFGAPPRAKNRALDRAFWCSPSCQKLCFLVWCSPSCHKSCFLVLPLVPKIVL